MTTKDYDLLVDSVAGRPEQSSRNFGAASADSKVIN